MISEADKLSRGLSAKDDEKRSHVGGGQNAAGRPSGANVALEKRGFRMNQMMAKAASKGGRTAAHGHSRHK